MGFGLVPELTRLRVLHCEVELTGRKSCTDVRGRLGKSKDQRMPSGCAITRHSFPPRRIALPQPCRSNPAGKTARNGMTIVKSVAKV